MTEERRLRRPLDFDPSNLERSIIARPLLDHVRQGPPGVIYKVVIDVNLDFPGGREEARAHVAGLVEDVLAGRGVPAGEQGIQVEKSRANPQYVFARLDAGSVAEIARRMTEAEARGRLEERSIYRIWLDFPVYPLVYRSVRTVKADAARASFAAAGEDIVWAVLDSGIDGQHPHFAAHATLALPRALAHEDFTGGGSPLTDEYGHGTHVAGVIAGELSATPEAPITAFTRWRDEREDTHYAPLHLPAVAGMAPRCKLLSMKVLDAHGDGEVSNLIAALTRIQELNGYGRALQVHGVNLSVGYPFDAEWFACGQSPLCVEVNRLVRSGVVVVVAAGNSGYGTVQGAGGGIRASLDLTVNDPGNAQLAVTVGATHRDMPHVYGVSYFSSKGPTGDGRPKPDLVAPGERILSCAAGEKRRETEGAVGQPCLYVEDSGTSMAAPHVSGVIAAFLSVRREFIGQAEVVKDVFMRSATDLRRDPAFQGSGLVDLMRAIQSV